MSALSIQPTYPIFTDIDGQPLEAGYVWIGTANLDPQTNPINVYWDAALTILAPQPIRTLSGYPSRNGAPGRIYVNSDYSIRIMNQNGSSVYSAPASTDRYNGYVINGINAENVIYNPPFPNAVQTNVEAKLSQTISVEDFGDVPLIAFNYAATELAAGGKLKLPKGTYSLSDKFTFTGQRLNIEGDGRNVSIISYSPASTGVAFEYNNPALGGLYQGSIKEIGFTSNNSIDKTAINLYNNADCEIHNIGIPDGSWQGTSSVGIRTYGRQTLSIRNCQIACARPIVFSQNPVFTSLNTDHYLVEHCELTTKITTGSSIEFENGVMHTNTTLRNLALTGGRNGILWNDTTSVGASYALLIENIRTEQAADANGWSIDLQSTAQSLQTVSIKNAFLDSGRNGIRLRRAQNVTLENIFFNQSSGTQLDVTLVAGSKLVLINCFFQTGGTKTITNGRCIRRSMADSTGNTIEEWVYDSASYAGAEYSDTYHHGAPVTLTTGSTSILGAAGTSTGFVFITSSEDVSAIFLLKGPTNATTEISDPDGFFTTVKNSASSYNIYYESGNYYLQNNRGVTATISVFKMLTTA